MKKGDSQGVVPAMPDTDPALPIVTAILRAVPASHWSFARIKPTGALASLLSSNPAADGVERLRLEFLRHRDKVKTGPRIAATLDALGHDESGITMIFADARSDFGILTLRRTAEDALFTSAEVALLTFALDSASERLSALRMNLELRFNPATGGGAFLDRGVVDAEAALYILDEQFGIALSWLSEEHDRIAEEGLKTRQATRLPAIVEDAVRALAASWPDDAPRKRRVAQPVPFLIVRAQPMRGATGSFIGVRVERALGTNSLSGAASRFRLSPREVQVLALLFDGSHLDEISSALHITSSTVQDHIKSMVTKTQSRNRSELIAHVLGWEFEPSSSA